MNANHITLFGELNIGDVFSLRGEQFVKLSNDYKVNSYRITKGHYCSFGYRAPCQLIKSISDARKDNK
jgi:hypothetical protein